MTMPSPSTWMPFPGTATTGIGAGRATRARRGCLREGGALRPIESAIQWLVRFTFIANSSTSTRLMGWTTPAPGIECAKG